MTLPLFDLQMRRQARPDAPGVRVEWTGSVVRQVGGPEDWNGILWSDLDAAGADAVIAEQLAFYGGLGRTFEWKLYSHDRPADLARRLDAAGFVADEAETLMVGRIGELSLSEQVPGGVELRPVRDAAGVELMSAVHEQAFGGDSSRVRHQLLTQLAERPQEVEAVVAMADGQPVSAARMQLHPGTDFASLWSGGTVESWRGRGLYRALVAYRARLAAARGYHFLQVDAAPTSRPILARLGFAALATTTPYLSP
ncbi:GNAT family N-acetyltransferase [Nonomuraea sp. NPDC059023]|uniref:GNAT family N-acetyltransferase n=1 Tax=unclassified Nonomuraea TaxID=2593643 RepID=UPI0036B226FB